ncbi:hypothetical protein AB0M02_39910 [Actinoplanes sp. NPDC051861]|uniref:hypothetical protein n=1 Tax=Actinoplanes sp. NPDC051861 TaxID=3155170 RepID=UPI003432D712
MTPLLLGGEMPHWSDREPTGGAALGELVAAASGHTLVVGPHDPALIEAVPARHVTVLVRGVPDAEALAARFASRPGFEVCCGSLEKLAAVPAYDTVIALDGLDRTGSAESPDISWAAGLSLLLAVLRPGGRLLLGVDNAVGLHRMLACAAEPGDAEWGSAFDPTRPTGPDRLRERLHEGGLPALRTYAAFPCPQSPSVLLDERLLDAPDLDGFVASALRRAGDGGKPLLADPRPLAVQLLRHGLAAATAPGWIVVAGRGAALPDGIVVSGAVTELTGGHLTNKGTGERLPVPAGRCLHDLLLAAVRGHDRVRLRALLTAWQGGETAPVDADAVIVDFEGRLHAVASPASPGEALRRFAQAVHDEGLAHLWPSPADSSETAALLGAIAGVEIGAGAARPPARALRELTAAHDRLARELREAKDQARWYDDKLAERDAELARAHRVISLLKGTVPGRAATAVRGALRTGKRAARTALTRLNRNP